MAEKKNNQIHDEELEKVSGGWLMPEDKEWVQDIMWYCVENNYSWSDVVEKWFPDIEPYCERVNATRSKEEQVTPTEIDNYMMSQFFVIGDRYLKGERRNSRKKK